MLDFDEMNKKRIVYELPGMEQARVIKNLAYKTVNEVDLFLDVYYPADLQDSERRPAVIFVHGLGPDELVKHIKDSGQYVSWGQLIAASGLIAVTFNHRSPTANISLSDIASDVDDLVSYVREHAGELRIDKDRLAIWVGSAGVPLGARSAFKGSPPFVRCLVVYYGPLHLQELQAAWKLTDQEVQEFSETTYLKEAENLPPLLIVKAGIDYPELNASIDSFIKEASAKNAPLDYMIHPTGRHAFDILDDVPRSHEIIKRTVEFMQTHLVS